MRSNTPSSINRRMSDNPFPGSREGPRSILGKSTPISETDNFIVRWLVPFSGVSASRSMQVDKRGPNQMARIWLLPALIGATAGILLVASALGLPNGQFRLDPVSDGLSSPAALGCGPSQCVAVSVQFVGATSLNPWLLELALTPLNHSEVINGSAGRTLNLSYSGGQPGWLGHVEPGTYVYPPCAIVVNPDGHEVATGSDSSIRTGSVLYLEGILESTVVLQGYVLTLTYGGVNASILIEVG